MIRRLEYSLTGPDGEARDITARVHSAGRLTEEAEDDLLRLLHSDLTVELDDSDGYMSELLAGAARGDVWELVIERETGARRPKWTRFFGGVLDVPGSIVFNRRDRTCSVQVWSYTKLLELASASAIARSVTNHVGTGTISTTTVTVSPGTDLLRAGDEIVLVSSAGTDRRTIATIASGTDVTLTEALTYGHTAAPLTLATPYPRGDSAESLGADLFAAAGIADSTIDLGEVLSGSLFPTSMSASGLLGGTPDAILEFGGVLCLYLGGKRYEATSSASGWTDEGTDAVDLDWQPYLATEPVALQQGTRTLIRDYADGTYPYYELVTVDAGATRTLRLKKNGATLVDVDTCDLADPADSFPAYYYEVAGYWGEVWVSYRKITVNRVRVWDPDAGEFLWQENTTYLNSTKRYDTAGTLLGTIAGAGPLRFVRADDRMAWMQTHDDGGLEDAAEIASPAVILMDGGTAASTLGAGSVDMWSFRRVGAYYAGVGNGNVLLWDAATLELLATYPLSSSPTSAIACAFTAGGTIDAEYDGWTSSMYFTLAKQASNVIPYADFDGLSCGAALRELAVVTASHFFVDQYKTGYLVGRASEWITTRAPVEIGVPLEQDERPVWDYLRRSVVVSGEAEDGTEISTEAGETGDSASRLSVTTAIPMTSALAGALAGSYLAYLSVSRRQSDETIDEPDDGPVRVLDLVTRDDTTWRALRVETDPVKRTQRLVLAEEVA